MKPENISVLVSNCLLSFSFWDLYSFF